MSIRKAKTEWIADPCFGPFFILLFTERGVLPHCSDASLVSFAKSLVNLCFSGTIWLRYAMNGRMGVVQDL
jgi:hypothetical protein